MPIKASQSDLSVFYRLELSNGLIVIIQATPLNVETGQRILDVFNEEYTLVAMLRPAGQSWPFLRGTSTNAEYVRQRLALPEQHARLMAYLMPLLTTFPPADELLDLAEAWLKS